MARKNDAITVIHADEGDFENMEDESPKPSGTEALRRTASMLETMGGTDQIGEGYIVVHAVEGQTETRCIKIPADKYSYDDLMDVIARDFGPGDYRVRLYLKSPHGRFVLTENRLEGIKAPRSENPLVPLPANAPADALLRDLIERQQRQMEALMEKQQAQLAGLQRPDLLAMAERVAVIATPFIPLLTATLGKRSSGIADLKGLLELTGVVKDLRDPAMPELPADQPAWAGLVSQGLQMLPSILAASNAGKAVAPVTHPAANPVPLPAPSEPAPVVPPLADTTGEPDVSVFVAQLPILLQSAGSGLQPSDAAHQLFSMIPADARGQVAETVGHPLFMKAMVRHSGGAILDVMDWVLYMREELLTLLEEDDGASAHSTQDHLTGDTGREAGDIDHIEGNASADPGIQE